MAILVQLSGGEIERKMGDFIANSNSEYRGFMGKIKAEERRRAARWLNSVAKLLPLSKG